MLANSYRIKATVPQKVTTRPLKPSDSPQELSSIDLNELNSLREGGRLMLEYERHGNKYALLKPDNRTRSDLFIQAIPARLIEELKRQHDNDYQFIVLRLFAPAATILARTDQRNDPISSREKESRIKTIFSDPPGNIDYYVDADRNAGDVALSIQQISQRYIRSNFLSTLSNLERTILKGVQEICQKARIPCALFGGAAAHIHGANRIPTDIDILVGSGGIELLENHMKRYEPSEVTPNKIICGRIDLRMPPVRIGDRSLGQIWDLDQIAVERSKPFSVDGIDINVISPEDVYVMKASLQRGTERGKFDVEDASAILDANSSILDWKYIEERANLCHVTSRVANFTKKIKENLTKSRESLTPFEVSFLYPQRDHDA